MSESRTVRKMDKKLRKHLLDLAFVFCFLVGFVVFLSFVPRWTVEQTKQAGVILISAIVVGAIGYGSLGTYLINKKQKRLAQWVKTQIP